MKQFMGSDFLLSTDTAVELYNNYSAQLPIIDYHCHLDPKMVAEDHQFSSITELWLGGDHYKWRLIRSDGVCEDEITGNADPLTKFRCFAKMLTKKNQIFILWKTEK